MTRIYIGCERAGTLFYEPNGLFLRGSVVPTNGSHSSHVLTFQLSYLGPGDIAVYIILESASTQAGSPAGQPSVTKAALRGTEALDNVLYANGRVPGVWLSYAMLPTGCAACRYTVWGQPGSSRDDLRGELVSNISGSLPVLTATTEAGVTRAPIPDVVREQPTHEWDQDSGMSSPLPRSATGRCRHLGVWRPPRAGRTQPRADGLIRNSRTYPPRQ